MVATHILMTMKGGLFGTTEERTYFKLQVQTYIPCRLIKIQYFITYKPPKNIVSIVAHEFGHSLGLSHSDVRDSLMAPFYRGYNPRFKLHEDDVQGIRVSSFSLQEYVTIKIILLRHLLKKYISWQSLYGKKTTPPPTRAPDRPSRKTPTLPSSSNSNSNSKDSKLCGEAKIDAITTMSDGNTYAFKGKAKLHFYSLKYPLLLNYYDMINDGMR